MEHELPAEAAAQLGLTVEDKPEPNPEAPEPWRPGDRIGAVMKQKGGRLWVLGYGQYIGQDVPPDDVGGYRIPGVETPKLLLDDGQVVWGCECWWGTETQIRALASRCEVVHTTIEELRRPKPDWVGFGKAILEGWPEPAGGGLDGLELQDMAASYHLLRKEQRTVPCGEACNCRQYCPEGVVVDCYVLNWDTQDADDDEGGAP